MGCGAVSTAAIETTAREVVGTTRGRQLTAGSMPSARERQMRRTVPEAACSTAATRQNRERYRVARAAEK